MTRRVLGPGFPGWDPVTIVGRVSTSLFARTGEQKGAAKSG